MAEGITAPEPTSNELAADMIYWYRLSMAKNTSFLLDEPLTTFIDQQIATGRFATTSEVIRHAMWRWKDEEEERARLRAILNASEQSGKPIDGAAAFKDVGRKLNLKTR